MEISTISQIDITIYNCCSLNKIVNVPTHISPKVVFSVQTLSVLSCLAFLQIATCTPTHTHPHTHTGLASAPVLYVRVSGVFTITRLHQAIQSVNDFHHRAYSTCTLGNELPNSKWPSPVMVFVRLWVCDCFSVVGRYFSCVCIWVFVSCITSQCHLLKYQGCMINN